MMIFGVARSFAVVVKDIALFPNKKIEKNLTFSYLNLFLLIIKIFRLY